MVLSLVCKGDTKVHTRLFFYCYALELPTKLKLFPYCGFWVK